MKTYTVKVGKNGTIRWYKPDTEELHREDGPAIEYANGSKYWYLNGKLLTEQQWQQATQSCAGKTVEIDGKKYKLVEVE